MEVQLLSRAPVVTCSELTAPPPLAGTRHTTEKYSLLFSFCARPILLSPNEKSIFLWCLVLTSKAAGLASVSIRSGAAEFPPPPPSAAPSLGRTGFLEAARFFSLPLPPCAEKVKELPCFSI